MKSKPQASWIPDDCKLPDSVEAIEAGRTPEQRQRLLFETDDSVMARLKRIKTNEVAQAQKEPRR